MRRRKGTLACLAKKTEQLPPQYLWGGHREDRARVCVVVHGRKIRDNGYKLK